MDWGHDNEIMMTTFCGTFFLIIILFIFINYTNETLIME